MITEEEYHRDMKETADRAAEFISALRKDVDKLNHLIHALLTVTGPVEVAEVRLSAHGEKPGNVSCAYNPQKNTRIYRALPA